MPRQIVISNWREKVEATHRQIIANQVARNAVDIDELARRITATGKLHRKARPNV